MSNARDPGTLIEIALADGVRRLGRTLAPPLVEFFNYEPSEGLNDSPDKIVDLERAFVICVRATWPRDPAWTIIGSIPLTQTEIDRPVVFYRQDMISKKLYRYWEDHQTSESFQESASFAECYQLEPVAVWEPNHVVERLEDLVAGRQSAIVERQRPVFYPDIHGTPDTHP